MTTHLLSSRLLSALCGGILLLSASGAHAWDLFGWVSSTATAAAAATGVAVNESVKVVTQTAGSAIAVVSTAAKQTATVVSKAARSVAVTAATTINQVATVATKTASTVVTYVPSLASAGLNPVAWVTTTVNAIASTLQTLTGAVVTTAQTAATQTGETAVTTTGAVATTASTAVNESAKVVSQVASSLTNVLTSAVDALLPDNPLILGSDDSVLPAHSTCGDAVAEAIQSCSGTIAMTGTVQRSAAPANFYWNHYPVLMIEGVDHNGLAMDGVSPDHAAVPVVSQTTLTGLRVAFNSTTRREYNWWDVFSGGTQYVEVNGSRGRSITAVAVSGLHY